MSIIKSEDSGKWINALVAIAALLAGFIVTKFVDQMGAWFDLEAKISSFSVLSQGVGVVTGLLVFVIVLKNSKTSGYLQDVYNELLKVVWPTKDATLKMTMGLVVALIVVASIFVFVDFVFKKILSFVY
ncbi:MAG: preprotein translocase subunit SecE [Bacteriovorax sp.]|nr:preprotein translocase subunit SecE [Bacteriovorax sp.]